jgi:hypothetical protein
LLKAYFRHPEDRRDRLGAEYSFCAFAWENGLRSVPQPLKRDRGNGLGLYEFVEGRPVRPQEINESTVRQALSFFSEINRYRLLPSARELPIASEAYFSLSDHLKCVQGRLEALSRINCASEIDCAAADFVHQSLAPAWEQVRSWVKNQACVLALDLGAEISRADRRLSPSDFGFHNALVTDCGRLCFLDFEYAGWDDPAKMVCDLFCQVARPVPSSHFDCVMESVASGLAEPGLFRARVAVLMPVYRLKWCCIVLNEFVRVSSNRRLFANAHNAGEDKKFEQLQKARSVLRSVTEERGIYGLR